MWSAGDDAGSSVPSDAALQSLPSPNGGPNGGRDGLAPSLPQRLLSTPPRGGGGASSSAAAVGGDYGDSNDSGDSAARPPEDADLVHHAAQRRARRANQLAKTLANKPGTSHGVDYDWVERCMRALRELAPKQLTGLGRDALWALLSRSRAEWRTSGRAFFAQVYGWSLAS